MHPEQIKMANNGSANGARRVIRAMELNNLETGRKDIMIQ
jgi:hypothetical protein